MIGNMRGERSVFKQSIGRWHFDLFLVLMFLCHAGLLVGVLLKMPSAGSQSMWIVLWLFMYGAAWVATWPAEDGFMV
ncbi:Pisatin demethylase [Venturia inaequalis]|nr:Pisatin demethylase [Venturia inaequalis]